MGVNVNLGVERHQRGLNPPTPDKSSAAVAYLGEGGFRPCTIWPEKISYSRLWPYIWKHWLSSLWKHIFLARQGLATPLYNLYFGTYSQWKKMKAQNRHWRTIPISPLIRCPPPTNRDIIDRSIKVIANIEFFSSSILDLFQQIINI